MPVNLLSFEAVAMGNYVSLDWSTASEINNMGFDVEVSYDNKNWNRFVFVDGNGNSNVVVKYNAKDMNPVNGVNYYRLKQMDFDGKYEYSGITVVDFNKRTPVIFNYSPNPAEHIVYVKHNINKDYQLRIYSVDGRLIIDKAMQSADSSIDISVLVAGFYNIVLTTNNETKVYKLIVK